MSIVGGRDSSGFMAAGNIVADTLYILFFFWVRASALHHWMHRRRLHRATASS